MSRLYSNLIKVVTFPIAILFVAIQRLLSPVVVIRLSYFNADRIGNLYPYYWYSCQNDKGKIPNKRTLDIYCCSKKIANTFWTSLYFKKLKIFHYNELFARILHFNRNSKTYIAPTLKPVQMVQNNELIKNVINYKEPYFKLNESDKIKGEKILNLMGVPARARFICFHNRDSTYLDIVSPGKNLSYHDYRDSSIKNYLKAAEFMTERGFYAVRMGAFVKEKLITNNNFIVDYPDSQFRSDFMDVYLGSQCELFICSDTGMSIIPELFDVPAVYVNVVPIGRFSNWIKNGIFIPKRFYSKKLNRDLTFEEIFSNYQLTVTPDTQIFLDEEIILIENNEDEILDATSEMIERLDNRWVETEEMEKLKALYWSMVPLIKTRSNNYNISSTYLVKNKHLLRKIND